MPEISRTEFWFSCLSLGIVFFLLPAAGWIHSAAPDPIYKFCAGLILGTISAVAFAGAIRIAKSVRNDGFLKTLTVSLKDPFGIFINIGIFLFGLFVWYASWTGNVGLPYGFGVFASQVIAMLGVGAIISSGR